MPEVKLEWRDGDGHSWINGNDGKAECWEHPDGRWSAVIRDDYGSFLEYRENRESAKAAVVAELLRRNEAERIALEGLNA